MRLGELTKLAPGFVIDLFLLRRDYDDEQHAIKREDPTKFKPTF